MFEELLFNRQHQECAESLSICYVLRERGRAIIDVGSRSHGRLRFGSSATVFAGSTLALVRRFTCCDVALIMPEQRLQWLKAYVRPEATSGRRVPRDMVQDIGSIFLRGAAP